MMPVRKKHLSKAARLNAVLERIGSTRLTTEGAGPVWRRTAFLVDNELFLPVALAEDDWEARIMMKANSEIPILDYYGHRFLPLYVLKAIDPGDWMLRRAEAFSRLFRAQPGGADDRRRHRTVLRRTDTATHA
jgi:hypothetical protein